MSFEEHKALKEDINISHRFFEDVKNSNIKEIKMFFLEENLKPWEFIEEDGYTGRNKPFMIALHKASFMDLYKSIVEMIESFKLRKDFNKTVLRNWINRKSNHGYTAILFASYRGNIDTIKYLIDNGADIYSINEQGINVIHMASQGNQPSSIVYFKEKYNYDLMSVDEVGSTALHWACYTGSEDAFNFLLSYNVNINSEDNEGLTSLHLAIISGILI